MRELPTSTATVLNQDRAAVLDAETRRVTRPFGNSGVLTRPQLAASLLLVSGILFAGCASSRAPTAAKHAVPGQRSTMSSGAAAPITQRLIELPGFTGTATPMVIRDPQAWAAQSILAPARQRQATSRLHRLGFRAGVRETLYGQGRSSVGVISLVEQFRSPAGARAEMRYAYLQSDRPVAQAGLSIHPFPVRAIPGALGTATAGPFATSRSVAFTAGPFYYQAVVITPRGQRASPSRRQLISACTSLYLRARAAPAV